MNHPDPHAFVLQLDRLYRRRWWLLSVYALALIASVCWLTGVIGRGSALLLNSRGPRIWSAHFWAEHPIIAFLGLRSWYSFGGFAPDGPRIAVEIAGTLAVIGASLATAAYIAWSAHADRSPRTIRWSESFSCALPAATVSLGLGAAGVLLLNWIDANLIDFTAARMWRRVSDETPLGLLVIAGCWGAGCFIFKLLSRSRLPYERAVRAARSLLWLSALTSVLTVLAWPDAMQVAFAVLHTSLWSLGVLAVLLLLWPAHRPSFGASLCSACGYDLTGTVEAGREVCPECGASADSLKSRESPAIGGPNLADSRPV